MIGIFAADGFRLGTVAKFVGNEPKRRWVAWSTAEPGGDGHGFPTRRAAMEWLLEMRKPDAEEIDGGNI